jgi:hypothetical protein
VTYVVSAVVLTALNGARDDVVAPDTAHAIRDDNGRIVAVPGFVRAEPNMAREILSEMVAMEWAGTAPGWSDYVCVYCGDGMTRGHSEYCPIVRGRALLGIESPNNRR